LIQRSVCVLLIYYWLLSNYSNISEDKYIEQFGETTDSKRDEQTPISSLLNSWGSLC